MAVRVLLSAKMKCTALIALAAVFCISHVDGSSVSEVKSIEKRQVPLFYNSRFTSKFDPPCVTSFVTQWLCNVTSMHIYHWLHQ